MDYIKDEIFMQRALELAQKGSGFTSPNPIVGAVICNSKEEIIAEGWHEFFGGQHAEINALQQCSGKDLSDCTMYVTLEPCDHHGKTPPCTEALISSGIKRVVVAMKDPHPLVNGKGNKKLREAGIEVVVGVLEQEAKRNNEAFVHFTKYSKPYVTLKTAQTLDGFVAMPNGDSKWITRELALERVHKLRAINDAVMIGASTAIKDNPRLTVRYGIKSRTPSRVVLDIDCLLPHHLNIFTDEYKEQTIVFTSNNNLEARAKWLIDAGFRVIGVGTNKNGLNLDEVLLKLGEMNITSVMVESGGSLAASFIENNLVNKLISFIAPKLFGAGIQVFMGLQSNSIDEAIKFNIHSSEPVGEDIMLTLYP